MQVSVVGSGYVGTTIAAVFAAWGHDVVAVDIDTARVDALNRGDPQIQEPGLQSLIDASIGERLRATDDFDAVAAGSCTVITVPTPTDPDGAVDTTAVEAAVGSVGAALEGTSARHLVILKSTVPPRAVETVVPQRLRAALGAPLGERVHLAVNPEFQAQGTAVRDFQDPQKLVFGAVDAWAFEMLDRLHAAVLQPDRPVVRTDPATAAMIKYANNVFLASKLSVVNELANICKVHAIDAYEVMDALGMDDRIGARFLRSGAGWGGSCFPKDTDALIAEAGVAGYDAELLRGVRAQNERQPLRVIDLLETHLRVGEATVTVCGAAFKPQTDDTRGTRTRPLLAALEPRAAQLRLTDPSGAIALADEFDRVEAVADVATALEGADAAVVMTAWPRYARLGEHLDAMAHPVVIDGRRAVEPTPEMIYEGLTW
ncbi:MAG: UDP-glucose/GDP-mannose dehydrogenase family protein [Haloferacaceae archaeon]|nr:UDP-glucose/GDP-mannose dehydrogenase family protein [Haloferacaceae archaeon]